MTREWVLFWSAISVMAVALAAATYANLGQPWDLGSLADWVAGLTTLAAVVVALHTASHQASLARELASQQRRDLEADTRAADIRFAKSVLFIGAASHLNAQTALPLIAGSGNRHGYTTTEAHKSLVRALNSLNLNLAPNTKILQHLHGIETRYALVAMAADFISERDNQERREAFNKALAQLDLFTNLIAKVCLQLGAKPEFGDDFAVLARLTAAQD